MSDPYRKAQETIASQGDGRQIEIAILTRINHALTEAAQSKDKMALVRAATENQMLWMAFVSDVALPTNKLPQPLRRSIAIVGMSVIKEIQENLDGDLDIEFLTSVNQDVIDGLKGNS